MNEVEIASNGTVWVGGMCGRVWKLPPQGTWIQVKSQTDAHVSGMSFPPNEDAGYIAGMRQSQTNQCIVRVQ